METVAEIIGDTPAVATAEIVEQVEAPRHPGQPAFPTPGIYFGMPEEEYHSIHACSASGLKRLSVSSMDYWALSTLNLDREDEQERQDGRLTPKELGKAYHCFICEGAVAFDKRYAVALDRDICCLNADAEGHPLCVTIADIRAEIDRLGGKAKGTSKDALIDQLYELDAAAHVWDRMVAEHNDSHAGKVMISDKLFRRIAVAKAMINGDPQLKDAFAGGYSEVSIFWYDEQTGIPMKSRLDYLKMNHLIDLKSFSNKQNKPIQRAVDMAISYEKYFIAVVVYLGAIAAAKKMIREKKNRAAFYYFSAHVERDGVKTIEWLCGKLAPTSSVFAWCWQWAHQPEPEVLFIFQQTGIAPVTRGRIMPTAGTYAITQGAVQHLKRKWAKCAKAYDVDPWLDFERVVQTEDESLTWAATDFGEIE